VNLEELRDQLEQLAGPETRATAAARDAVRRRVGRHRRRMGATSAVAGALVIAIVGVGLLKAQDSQVKVRTVPSTAPPPNCRLGDVGTVPANKVPADVAAWSHGEPVVGHGALWTVTKLLSNAPTLDHGAWRTKIAWFTRPFGIPDLRGRRLDGAGTFHADANRAVNASGVWVASSLEFSAAGCWEVSVGYRNVGLVFRILVGPARGTISGSLLEVGGPAPGLDVAIPGAISVESATASAAASTSTGDFSVDVPAGTYTVSGTSPRYNGGLSKCYAEGPVVVRRGRTTTVKVICAVR
jgi:hypothetical protein